MSITPSQPVGFASSPITGQLPGDFVVPGSFFLARHRQACKHPVNDRSKPLHVRPPVSNTGARHEEHRPPGFPAFHAYGVQ